MIIFNIFPLLKNLIIGVSLMTAQARIYLQGPNMHVPESEPKVSYMQLHFFPNKRSEKYLQNRERLNILSNYILKKRELLKIRWKANYINSSLYRKVKISRLTDYRQKTYAKANYYKEKDRITNEFNSSLLILKNDMFAEYKKVSLNEKNLNKK